MEERLPRKLTVIFYADVAGYSRLTGADEDATHRKLGEYLDFIAESISYHHGGWEIFAKHKVVSLPHEAPPWQMT